MLQIYQQFQNEINKEELFIQQCEHQLLLLAECELQQHQQEQQNHQDQDHVTDNNMDVDTNIDTNDNTNNDTNNNTNRKRQQKQQVQRRRSKRIRHKNHGDYAMTMNVVKARLKELGIVTPEEADSHDFIIRLAEKSDLSATTKEELQQQVLHLCRYGLLARWVLQDDGSRILEIVRCSGIEGHHKNTRSSWVHPENHMRNHRLNVGGKIICVSVPDCFVIFMS